MASEDTEKILIALNEFSIRVDERFEKVDERFDRMDERFDRIEKRLDRLESAVAEIRDELSEIRRRLEMLEKRTREDSNALAEVAVDLRNRLSIAERNIKELQFRLDQQKVPA